MQIGPASTAFAVLFGHELISQVLSSVRAWVVPSRPSLVLQAGSQTLTCPECTCNCDSPGTLRVILVVGFLVGCTTVVGLLTGFWFGARAGGAVRQPQIQDGDRDGSPRRRGGGRLVQIGAW